MSFGMFLLALLTFVYLICHQYSKTPSLDFARVEEGVLTVTR